MYAHSRNWAWIKKKNTTTNKSVPLYWKIQDQELVYTVLVFGPSTERAKHISPDFAGMLQIYKFSTGITLVSNPAPVLQLLMSAEPESRSWKITEQPHQYWTVSLDLGTWAYSATSSHCHSRIDELLRSSLHWFNWDWWVWESRYIFQEKEHSGTSFPQPTCLAFSPSGSNAS